MADQNGNIDTDKLAEFKPTMELRLLQKRTDHGRIVGVVESLQQKWTNELGGEQWRDIPVVIN